MTSRPDLRPRSIGENLDAGFKLFTSNFKDLLTIAAVVLLPVAVITAALSTTVANVDVFEFLFESGDTAAVPEGLGAFLGVLVLNGLLGSLAGLVVQASAVKIIGDAYQGIETHWREALSTGFRRFFAIFLTGLLIAVIAIVTAVAGLIVVFVIGTVVDWLAVVVALFGALALLVSIFTLAYVAVPALIVESLSPMQAIRRSVGLVRARFWPTFWTGLLGAIIVGVISAIIGGIIQIAVIVPASFDAAQTGELSGGLISAVNSVSNAVVNLFSVPFLAAVGLAVYFDLRVRLEGFDIELLAAEMDEAPHPGLDPPDRDDPFGLGDPGA